MTLKDHLRNGTDFATILSMDFAQYQDLLERVYTRSFSYVHVHMNLLFEEVKKAPEGHPVNACLLPDDLPLIVAEIVEEETPSWNLVQQTVLYTLVLASCVDNSRPEFESLFEAENQESNNPKFKMN